MTKQTEIQKALGVLVEHEKEARLKAAIGAVKRVIKGVSKKPGNKPYTPQKVTGGKIPKNFNPMTGVPKAKPQPVPKNFNPMTGSTGSVKETVQRKSQKLINKAKKYGPKAKRLGQQAVGTAAIGAPVLGGLHVANKTLSPQSSQYQGGPIFNKY